MSDSQWYEGFSSAFSGLAYALYFIKSVLQGFIDILNEQPLLTVFLGICVFCTVVFFGLNFFINLTDGFDYSVEGFAHNSIVNKRYQERQAEREFKNEQRYQQRKKEAEERYQQRKKEREEEYKKRQAEKYPNSTLNPADLYENYFKENPNRISFSYGGVTYYNNELLENLKGLSLNVGHTVYNPKKHRMLIQRNGSDVVTYIFDKKSGELLDYYVIHNV